MGKGNGFFDCMIVASGGRSCRASDLYTKKDPFISRPQSFHDLSVEEKQQSRDRVNYSDRGYVDADSN